MTTHIRSFTTFSMFFVATSIVFWTVLVGLVTSISDLSFLIYWGQDVLLNVEMLIEGIHLPDNNWLLAPTIPAFFLTIPTLVISNHGPLTQAQHELYEVLIGSISSPWGLLGWLLTLLSIGAFVSFTVWSLRKSLCIPRWQSVSYLAIWTVILGTAVALI
jgi:hypothetical protein